MAQFISKENNLRKDRVSFFSFPGWKDHMFLCMHMCLEGKKREW